jgi:hypothetical protein
MKQDKPKRENAKKMHPLFVHLYFTEEPDEEYEGKGRRVARRARRRQAIQARRARREA